MPGHAFRPISAADLLAEYEERAAIMEYLGGMTRAQAEREAWKLVYGGEQMEMEQTRGRR